MVKRMLISETELLDLSRREVRRFHQKYIRSEHILLALLNLDSSCADEFQITYEELSSAIAKLPVPTCGAEEKLELAMSAKRALSIAQNQSEAENNIDTGVLLTAIIKNSPLLRRLVDEIKGKQETKRND